MPVPSGVVALWPGTHAGIPAGWTRVTSLDDRYVKGTAAGVDPDVTGGAATHTHTSPTHVHSIPSHNHTTNPATGGPSSSSFIEDELGIGANELHTHTVDNSSSNSGTSGTAAATWGTTSSDPPYVAVIFISSDGTPTGIPSGAWAWWDADPLPSGWTQPVAAQDKHPKGAAAGGDGGGTGGAASCACGCVAQSLCESHPYSYYGCVIGESELEWYSQRVGHQPHAYCYLYWRHR